MFGNLLLAFVGFGLCWGLLIGCDGIMLLIQ